MSKNFPVAFYQIGIEGALRIDSHDYGSLGHRAQEGEHNPRSQNNECDNTKWRLNGLNRNKGPWRDSGEEEVAGMAVSSADSEVPAVRVCKRWPQTTTRR